jgi:hypothetical protein
MGNGNGKSLESWIWDAAYPIRGAKDAPKFTLPPDDAVWSVIRTLSKNLAGIQKKDRCDVMFANPTFGLL